MVNQSKETNKYSTTKRERYRCSRKKTARWWCDETEVQPEQPDGSRFWCQLQPYLPNRMLGRQGVIFKYPRECRPKCTFMADFLVLFLFLYCLGVFVQYPTVLISVQSYVRRSIWGSIFHRNAIGQAPFAPSSMTLMSFLTAKFSVPVISRLKFKIHFVGKNRRYLMKSVVSTWKCKS